VKQYLNGLLKFHKTYLYRVVVVLLLILIVASGSLSCGKKTISSSSVNTTSPYVTEETLQPPETPLYATGTVNAGESKTVADDTVPDVGGEVVVNEPGSPVNGLSINIPEGAYDGIMSVKISTAPINSTTFENVNPITPLISVDNGGGFAADLITIDVPVTIPEGKFAMGFYYDEARQMLEPIPTVAMDGDSITLATCHFSDFFISVIDALKLENPKVDSNFWLLRDNWQFPNPTVAFSTGICAGMSVSSIYYFYNKPDGPGQLYGRYSGKAPAGTPDIIWEDDKDAIRIASSVQADYEETGSIPRDKYKALLDISDNVTVKEFAYAMMVIKGPQLALLPRHAMVATAVQDNTILICDPNFPNELRPTHWKNGKLVYFDGKVDQPIVFMAMGAMCPWDQVGKRWAEFKTGYPGADRFPGDSRIYLYNTVTGKDLLNTDGSNLEITSGIYLPFNEIWTYGAQPNWNYSWGGSLTTGDILHYWKNGNTWAKKTGTQSQVVSLSQGANDIGFEWVGTTVGGNYGDANKGWLDFKWMTINYQPLDTLTIEPASWSGVPNRTHVFTTTSPTTLTGLRFRWLVNGVEVQNGPKQVYELNPDRADKYTITLEAWNDAVATPYILQTATAIANTTDTAEPTWSPPDVTTPTIKITSHAEGDTITSSPFSLTVEYTFPNPEGGRIVVTVTPTDSLDNPNASWSETAMVTNRSGTLTFKPEIRMGKKSGQLLVEVHISAPAVNLWGNDEDINLVIKIP